MKILITHEESQTVMTEFLKLGFDAYSNDLLPCSGDYPERHLRMDCFEAIELIKPDFLGMHPECTRLTVAANKYYKPEYSERFPNIHEERKEAVDHFFKCVEALKKVGKGYIENPIGIMSSRYRKPDQIIQPYQFGHTERKSTCLWLADLPKLNHTDIVEPDIIYHKSGRTDSRMHFETLKLPKEERRKARSKTFTGIAKAMAEQWTKEKIQTELLINKTKIMKTSKDFTELDFNELAFFAGINAIDAKWEIASTIYPVDKIEVNDKGTPKVTKKDVIKVEKYDFKMKSNSVLEGKSRLIYLCDYYNKGTDNQHLKTYSESKTFVKAIAFTGTNSVLNEILNREQYLKLQKSWLFTNVYTNHYLTANAEKFIKKHKWAIEYLTEKGIDMDKKKTQELV